MSPAPKKPIAPDTTSLQSLALASQGLANRDAFAAGQDAAADAINRLGFLQIDTISVVSRAHHHTLWNA